MVTKPNMAAFVGEDSAPALDSLLTMLALLPPDVLWGAVRQIDRAEAVGPLLDPTAWMGNQFARALKWKQLFEHLARASDMLHEQSPTDRKATDEGGQR